MPQTFHYVELEAFGEEVRGFRRLGGRGKEDQKEREYQGFSKNQRTFCNYIHKITYRKEYWGRYKKHRREMVLKKKRKSKGKILICEFLVKNAWKSLLERKISRHFSWSSL